MVDSTTAIEIALKGPNTVLACLAVVCITWLYCKIKDLIYGDE